MTDLEDATRPAASLAANAPPVPRPRRVSPGTETEIIDALGLFVLGMVALTGMATAFGGVRFLIVGGLGLVLGGGIAWLLARAGRPIWTVALAVAGVYLIIGPLLLAPSSIVSLVLPSPSVLRAMASGTYQSWPNLLTTAPPVGGAQKLLIVPWLSGLVVGSFSMSVARRAPRAYLVALAGPFALLVAGIIVGTKDPAWALQATVFAFAALLWGSLRQRAARAAGLPVRRRNRLAGTVGVLAVAGIVGNVIGSSSFVVDQGNQRKVVREHVRPPVDLRDVASPLEQFRAYRDTKDAEQPDPVVFSVDGLRRGDRIRLATLDHYDGVVWYVDGDDQSEDSASTFQRVGEQVPSTTDGKPRTLEITIGDYTGVWVPTVGPIKQVSVGGDRAEELAEAFRYNLATDTAVVPEGLQQGDRFTIDAEVVETQRDLVEGEPDPVVKAQTPKPYAVPNLSDRAAEYLVGTSKDATPLGRVRALERRLRGDGDWPSGGVGILSSGRTDLEQAPSLPGHSAQRMRTMLDPANNMVGDEEQFASAMALLADALGFPSRVVVGFAPTVASGGGTTDVRSGDITAWTEIAVEGHGWVPLFPTPTDTETPTEDKQPIPPPDRLMPAPPKDTALGLQRRAAAGAEGTECRTNCDSSSAGAPIPTFVKVAGTVILLPLLLLGAATALMALLKVRRRKRRRTAGTPESRISAGWSDICDLAVDLGDVVPVAATRREEAVILARPGVAALAQQADALVFGPEPVTDEVAARYWDDVDTTRGAMLAPATAFDRWKALVNPTSLRRHRPLRSIAVSVRRPTAAAAGATSRMPMLRKGTA